MNAKLLFLYLQAEAIKAQLVGREAASRGLDQAPYLEAAQELFTLADKAEMEFLKEREEGKHE